MVSGSIVYDKPLKIRETLSPQRSEKPRQCVGTIVSGCENGEYVLKGSKSHEDDTEMSISEVALECQINIYNLRTGIRIMLL
jgi:hypothetical protein